MYTILVAEDSPTQAKILQKSLEGNEFEILLNEDGLAAFEQLEDVTPDLIISDLEMPRMNGFEFCEAVKNHEVYKNIPFILVTTLNDPDSILKGIEKGADSYITKPYTADSLLSKVNSLVGQSMNYLSKGDSASVLVNDKEYDIKASKQHILNFFLATYQNVVRQNEELMEIRRALNKTNQKLENSRGEMQKVLHNVFPTTVADYLISHGSVSPERYEEITVVFTDFVNFSKSAEKMTPDNLVLKLEDYFNEFDTIVEKYKLEKIKTIGDSYMYAGGLPIPNNTHAVDCVLAALEMMQFVQDNLTDDYSWNLRIGINTGPAVAGIIGSKRFAYDIWGSSVNVANRMEQSSIPGLVNISESTYQKVKGFFYCESRGAIDTKNNGMMPMYFVKGLHAHLHEENKPLTTNDAFQKKYALHKRITL